jgi:hypothetical protein
MGLNGGMGWPVRYITPVEDMQDMQTSPSDTKGRPHGGAVCAADMQDAANSRHRSVIQLGGIINREQDVGILVTARL